MKKKYFAVFVFSLLGTVNSIAQSLGRVGNPNDIVTTPTAGTVLMGGGSDVDAAFTWMINKSVGGDFVVIRATGTDAYNDYIYGLGTANSVETFLVNSISLANDSMIVKSIRKAEAVFFAGGDQNDYIANYKGTALGTVIDYLANIKHAPIGGTSAGMAIQGYIYYDGITNVLSSQVLQNPYASGNGIHYNDFLHNPFLINTICDTHFNTKGGTTSNGITGRQGRLMTFLSRMIIDSSLADVKAIACEEKTAVCIDENGIAMVIGLGKSYFLRQWCHIPEDCVEGDPLTWTNGAKVYIINGPGSYTTLPNAGLSVNLNDWATVAGGIYNYWTVNTGTLTIGQTTGSPNVCNIITTYTFTGNGNWSVPGNWLNNLIPPAQISGNAEIVINPVLGGECILDIDQTISQGVNLTVQTGKRFRIIGNLNVQ
ncbi:MAG: cyanophycinase [Ferruginibacter sp.]